MDYQGVITAYWTAVVNGVSVPDARRAASANLRRNGLGDKWDQFITDIKKVNAGRIFAKSLERYQLNTLNNIPGALEQALDDLKHVPYVIPAFLEKVAKPYTPSPEEITQLISEFPTDLKFNSQTGKPVSEQDLEDTVIRYAKLKMGGQQWAVPRVVYSKIKSLAKELGGKGLFEAFASPMNRNPESELWCSLFTDDAPFGSLGSLFEIDPVVAKGYVVVMNPPFMTEILDKAVEMFDKLAEHAVACVFIGPAWSTMEWHQKLHSKYTLIKMELDQYVYEISSDDEHAHRKRLSATFPSSVFVTRPELIPAIQEWPAI